MNLISVLIICFHSILPTISYPMNQGCNRDAKARADTCADKLWFVGRNSRIYPENEFALQKYCKQTSNLIKCVKDFTDMCGNEGQRQLANVMLFTMRVNNKMYCTKSVKRQEFVSLGVCGNRIREESSQCMDNFLVMLGKSNAFPNRYKVPHACCSFHKLKECILRSAYMSDQRLCSEDSVQYLEKYMDTISANTLNLMCTDYEDSSDKCRYLPSLARGVKYSKALTIIEGFAKILDYTRA